MQLHHVYIMNHERHEPSADPKSCGFTNPWHDTGIAVELIAVWGKWRADLAGKLSAG
jgi:hypothetical protein